MSSMVSEEMDEDGDCGGLCICLVYNYYQFSSAYITGTESIVANRKLLAWCAAVYFTGHPGGRSDQDSVKENEMDCT